MNIQRASAAAAAAAVLLLAGACGSDDPSAAPTTSNPTAAAAGQWYGQPPADVAAKLGCTEFEAQDDEAGAQNVLGTTWLASGDCTYTSGDQTALVTIYTFTDQAQQDAFNERISAAAKYPGADGNGVVVLTQIQDFAIAPSIATTLGLTERPTE
jgi:hypothetical protein